MIIPGGNMSCVFPSMMLFMRLSFIPDWLWGFRYRMLQCSERPVCVNSTRRLNLTTLMRRFPNGCSGHMNKTCLLPYLRRQPPIATG